MTDPIKYLDEVRDRLEHAKGAPDNYWGNTFLLDIDRMERALRVSLKGATEMCGGNRREYSSCQACYWVEKITRILNGEPEGEGE